MQRQINSTTKFRNSLTLIRLRSCFSQKRFLFSAFSVWSESHDFSRNCPSRILISEIKSARSRQIGQIGGILDWRGSPTKPAGPSPELRSDRELRRFRVMPKPRSGVVPIHVHVLLARAAQEMAVYAKRPVLAAIQRKDEFASENGLRMRFRGHFGQVNPLPSSFPECPFWHFATATYFCLGNSSPSSGGYPQPEALRRLNVLVKVKQLAARKAVDSFLEFGSPCA